MKRLFKKIIIDEGNYTMYEPTIYKKGSVSISDSFAKQKRLGLGSFDAVFLIKNKKK